MDGRTIYRQTWQGSVAATTTKAGDYYHSCFEFSKKHLRCYNWSGYFGVTTGETHTRSYIPIGCAESYNGAANPVAIVGGANTDLTDGTYLNKVTGATRYIQEGTNVFYVTCDYVNLDE